MLDKQETRELWMIRRTAMQLLRDRGYLIVKEEIKQTLEQFKKQFGEMPKRSDLNIRAAHTDDPTDQIYVFFSDKPKVNIAALKAYCIRMQEGHVGRAIIVAKEGMTPIANLACGDMAPKYILEKFLEKELVVNITEHELVPEHVKMTSEETQEVLERYNIKKSQLPRIPHDDIVARYYGLRRGDAVRIIHCPETTVSGYIMYRIVV